MTAFEQNFILRNLLTRSLHPHRWDFIIPIPSVPVDPWHVVPLTTSISKSYAMTPKTMIPMNSSCTTRAKTPEHRAGLVSKTIQLFQIFKVIFVLVQKVQHHAPILKSVVIIEFYPTGASFWTFPIFVSMPKSVKKKCMQKQWLLKTNTTKYIASAQIVYCILGPDTQGVNHFLPSLVDPKKLFERKIWKLPPNSSPVLI